jgi:hypothetical protein
MPDIGLLQGVPPRRGAPPSAPAESTADEIARQFPAVPAQAITVQVVSTPAAAVAALQPQVPEQDGALSGAGTPRAMPLTAVPPPIRARDLCWLALALVVIIGTGIGIRDPWPADEPRFAAVARDMMLTGEWLFPRVGGDLYQDKPPLFFWMLAACYAVFGSLRWSFLVPSFVAAGGTLFLIYDLGRRLVSREAGLAAAVITVCTLHFVMVMRGAQIDPVLCGMVTLSL